MQHGMSVYDGTSRSPANSAGSSKPPHACVTTAASCSVESTACGRVRSQWSPAPSNPLVAEATTQLEHLGNQPFAHRMGRELAEAAAGGRWGLPPGLPSRADRVIRLAGAMSAVARVALDMPDDSLSTSASTQRRQVLRRLLRGSERALADAASAACAALAGWVPAR